MEILACTLRGTFRKLSGVRLFKSDQTRAAEQARLDGPVWKPAIANGRGVLGSNYRLKLRFDQNLISFPSTNHQLFNRAPFILFSTEQVDSERVLLGSIDPGCRSTPVSTCSLLRVYSGTSHHPRDLRLPCTARLLRRIHRGCSTTQSSLSKHPSIPSYPAAGMSDIDDELLALAGGDVSSDEEEEMNVSRDDSRSPPPAKKKETTTKGVAQKKAPAKKAKKRSRDDDSEEEGEA